MKQVALLFLTLFIFGCKEEFKNTVKGGEIFGTGYSIIYDSEVDYEKEFDSLFYSLNKSLSTYQPNSIISRINRDEIVEPDVHFENVFKVSKEIFYNTEGAFDPTIGAIVNAWDFGPESKIIDIDSLKIDSLMKSVGFEKILRIDNHFIKPKDAFIDFNAIAKGYGVDVIGEFLESQNIKNYLVEIGGEIRSRGINVEKQKPWKIGVEMPHFDGTQSIMKAISVQDEAMATSGTYRKYKLDDKGNRYAHIIDTKTGYPSKSNLLSVSVIADRCMVADAYATAFQAMGIEKVKEFLKVHPKIKVFLIYENEDKELITLSLNGFPE